MYRVLYSQSEACNLSTAGTDDKAASFPSVAFGHWLFIASFLMTNKHPEGLKGISFLLIQGSQVLCLSSVTLRCRVPWTLGESTWFEIRFARTDKEELTSNPKQPVEPHLICRITTLKVKCLRLTLVLKSRAAVNGPQLSMPNIDQPDSNAMFHENHLGCH